MYRNYNGHGAAFGDTEVKASTSAPQETSVYGSIEHGRHGPRRHRRHQQASATRPGHAQGSRGSEVHGRSGVHAHERRLELRDVPPACGRTAVDTFGYTMPAQSVSVIVPAAPASATGRGAPDSVTAGRPGLCHRPRRPGTFEFSQKLASRKDCDRSQSVSEASSNKKKTIATDRSPAERGTGAAESAVASASPRPSLQAGNTGR